MWPLVMIVNKCYFEELTEKGFNLRLYCKKTSKRAISPAEILFAQRDVQHSFRGQNIQRQSASPERDA